MDSKDNQHTLSEKTSENVFTHHPGLMHLSYFYIFNLEQALVMLFEAGLQMLALPLYHYTT